MPRQQHSIVINTDGACSGNPGPGGFAAIIVIDGDVSEPASPAAYAAARAELCGLEEDDLFYFKNRSRVDQLALSFQETAHQLAKP